MSKGGTGGTGNIGEVPFARSQLGGGLAKILLLSIVSAPLREASGGSWNSAKESDRPSPRFSQAPSSAGVVAWREPTLLQVPGEARTSLWQKLSALRAQALAAGMRTLSRDEILAEIRQERGEEGDG